MTSTAQENLLATLEYLLHLDRLRSRPIFRLSDHKLPFFHEHNFADLPGIETNLVEGEQEVWLSIRRLQANQPPKPHEWLRPWINIPNDPGKKPTMAESIVIHPDDLPPIEIFNHEEIEADQNDLFGASSKALADTSEPNEAPPEDIDLRLEDVPEIQGMFDRYLAEQWTSWSETEQPRRKTIHKYDRFFSLTRRSRNQKG